MRQIGQNGLDLLRHVEGVVMSVYLDSIGIPTAGVGHVIRPEDGDLNVGDAVTTEQVDAWLQQDLAEAAAVVDAHFPDLPTQNARDALVSFAFNCGPGAPGRKDGLIWLTNGNHSTLYRLLVGEDWSGAADEFKHWTRAGNTHPRGLRIRRALERDLFLAPDGPMPDGWLASHDHDFDSAA